VTAADGGLVLGIDLGYSGARAAVANVRAEVVAAGQRFPVPTRASFGRAEQDPADWLRAVELAIRSALAGLDALRIEAIGISALGPAPVLIDERLNPLTPALLFGLDTRAESERRRLAVACGLGDDRLNHDHATPKLEWWRTHEPELWSQAAWAVDAAGFLVGQLTGSPTMDTITLCDYTLNDYPCPLPLPPARDALTIAGGLTGAWAARTGLAAGTPVAVGTYDAYADTAAAGVLEVGDACIVLGSTLIIGVAADQVPEDLRGLESAPHLGKGMLVGGWPATGGSAISWARRLIGLPETISDDALEQAARALPPGASGLVFLPYLTGERSPVHDPAARGVLLGLTVETTPATAYRAVVDGVALSVRDHLSRLAALELAPSVWRVTGGGTQSQLLLQAISDALRAPLEVVADASAPIGPCRIALNAIGHGPAVVVAAVVEPSTAHADRFDGLYDVYRSLYPALSRAMHQLTEFDQTPGGRQ